MSRRDGKFGSEGRDDIPDRPEDPEKRIEQGNGSNGSGNGDDQGGLPDEGEGPKPDLAAAAKRDEEKKAAPEKADAAKADSGKADKAKPAEERKDKVYEYKPREQEKPRRSSSHIPRYALFAGVFILGIIIGAIATPSVTGPVTGGVVTGDACPVAGAGALNDIGVDAAAQRLVDYVNVFPTVTDAKSAGEADSTDVYYEINIDVTTADGTQTVPLMISRDGKYLMQATDIDEAIQQIQELQEQESQPVEAAGTPKSDRPKVDVFIMSYCPYGLQMQKAVLPVMELLGDKADITIKWVSYIMHGKQEIDENNVQYCIQKEQSDKYIAYANCFTVKDDTVACIAEAGIDRTMLESCVVATDKEFNITGLYEDSSTWSGGRYPQYPVNAAENTQFGVRGSPTLIINGNVVSVNRSPEAVKQAVCSAFNTPPGECDQELSTAQASASFGASEGSGAEGSCE